MKTYSKEAGSELMRSIRCGLCGDQRVRPGWICDGFSFVRCRTCRVYYQNPQPQPETLLNRYDEEYFAYERAHEEAFFGLMLKGLNDAGFPDWTWPGAQRRVLDIGCATGRLLLHLRDQGWQGVGVEVCSPSVQFARTERGLDVRLGTLDQAGLSPASFELIHFSHVIEHVPDPVAFLKEVARLLAPGGKAVITTPNFQGWQARWFQERWRSAIADHLYLFDPATLTRALGAAGLKPGRFHTWGGWAVGARPRWLKPWLDPLAKAWGGGDVMLTVAQRSS